MIDAIRPEDVDRYLCNKTRKLGEVTFHLISTWDYWVKRRVEQIELVSDAAAKRRSSVDFRLNDAFDEGVIKEGKEGREKTLHYVPLTLLKKAPVMSFDLRDETQTALPLLTRKKTAAIEAAALVTATQVMVVRQFFETDLDSDFAHKIRAEEVEVDTIHVPDEVQAAFINLCVLPFEPRTKGKSELTAPQINKELLAKTINAEQTPVHEWPWAFDEESGVWRANVSFETWLWGIFDEPVLMALVYDFTRLYMVAAPVEAEPDRRRILKFEYEEHYSDPGLKIIADARARISKQAGWLRRKEDRLEGLRPNPTTARQEWTLPRSAMNIGLRRPRLREAISRGIGWQVKPIDFSLPSVGLGGSFHLEMHSPEGTQLRRAELRALDKRDEEPHAKALEESAWRYARNVTGAHLYLGGPRNGTWGYASMEIKPKSSTVIRGAALAASVIVVLILAALAMGELSSGSRTTIAILLLAPGIVAAIAGQPSEHSVTSKMVFGLRLLALSVAGVALGAASLLGAQVTFCDHPLPWLILLLFAASLAGILLTAWRLAGRDWPRNL